MHVHIIHILTSIAVNSVVIRLFNLVNSVQRNKIWGFNNVRKIHNDLVFKVDHLLGSVFAVSSKNLPVRYNFYELI